MHLFVNDLTVIDFSYLDTKRGIVGESWIVDVALIGGLNEQNMVLDFGIVKSQIKKIIDNEFDHKLHIPEDAGALVANEHKGDNQDITFKMDSGDLIYVSAPPSMYCFSQTQQITIEDLLPVIKQTVMLHMPENVNDVRISLRAEQINSPYYHYSHGLKKHDGNCQRIVHGHRSKVTVLTDEQPDGRWQMYWQDRWRDIYIGSEDDLSPQTLVAVCQQHKLEQDAYVGFAYTSSQGDFALVIPKQICDVVDRDTTVECLAEYMLEQMLAVEPETKFEVHAYEGVSKGAIAIA
ncbi:6-carboxytetrahydropterin synthase [Catenovulum sp. SM1970]|uniref:6-carboxytetrahydropterin synthase n=1 Tax=Marinifaba aquimaris TaxID=2741323 RepID=UPI001571CB8D|nr:6-carboxytetrahydropterin synthase [Marinifaba aquimaris]NTS77643.1 6-carboxytetrahydropterin synthase [Marinifaba aquimaris]